MKRIQTSSISWTKLADRLTPEYAAELSKLKGQNTTFQSIISQLPSDLPKVDWADVKKKLGPSHSSVLETLQKQYEAISIPYGTIPDKMTKEIEDWTKYNNARGTYQQKKLNDEAIYKQKVEEKWGKAPPIEHMDDEQYVAFFEKHLPDHPPDLRTNHHYIIDPLHFGYNYKPEWKEDILWRTKHYRDRKRYNKPRDEMEVH